MLKDIDLCRDKAAAWILLANLSLAFSQDGNHNQHSQQYALPLGLQVEWEGVNDQSLSMSIVIIYTFSSGLLSDSNCCASIHVDDASCYDSERRKDRREEKRLSSDCHVLHSLLVSTIE
jgi:hypothetical protein